MSKVLWAGQKYHKFVNAGKLAPLYLRAQEQIWKHEKSRGKTELNSEDSGFLWSALFNGMGTEF